MSATRDMEAASSRGKSTQPVDDVGDELDVDPRKVGNLFNALHQTLRACQLYGLPNPATERQLEALKSHFREAWQDLDKLDVLVQETSFSVGDHVVHRSASRKDSLSFVFYKDGIRQLTFHPGFEDSELQDFIEVLQKAFFQRSEEDDLVTLFWKQDFSKIQYSYVEVDAEEIAIPDEPEDEHKGFVRALARNMHREATSTEDTTSSGNEMTSVPSGDPAALPETTTPHVHSKIDLLLDPKELKYLRDELERELRRDVCADVINALLDCLEEPNPVTQTEILEIVRDLVPRIVLQGRLKLASQTLQELRTIARKSDLLKKTQRQELDRIFEEIGSSSAIEELLVALEAGYIVRTSEEIEEFFDQLGSGALEPLIRAASKAGRKELRTTLDAATLAGATRHPQALLDALKSQDAVVVRGAVRLISRQGRSDVAPRLAPLFKHRDTRVRLSVVEAAVTLGGPAVFSGIRDALRDPDRDVRVAAAWGIGTWHDQGALSSLLEIVEGNTLRKASLTEKIAMLDALARVGGEQAIPPIAEILNGRSFFRQSHLPEMRACAARALGLVGAPEARSSLKKAQNDRDVTVRRAVVRALRKAGENADR